jgi:hypothetical protein
MNQANLFIPSDQLRLRSSNAGNVTKAASVSVEEGEGTFSKAEIEFARNLTDDTSGDARLYMNGELVRVGLQWLPGAKEKWGTQ